MISFSQCLQAKQIVLDGHQLSIVNGKLSYDGIDLDKELKTPELKVGYVYYDRTAGEYCVKLYILNFNSSVDTKIFLNQTMLLDPVKSSNLIRIQGFPIFVNLRVQFSLNDNITSSDVSVDLSNAPELIKDVTLSQAELNNLDSTTEVIDGKTNCYDTYQIYSGRIDNDRTPLIEQGADAWMGVSPQAMHGSAPINYPVFKNATFGVSNFQGFSYVSPIELQKGDSDPLYSKFTIKKVGTLTVTNLKKLLFNPATVSGSTHTYENGVACPNIVNFSISTTDTVPSVNNIQFLFTKNGEPLVVTVDQQSTYSNYTTNIDTLKANFTGPTIKSFSITGSDGSSYKIFGYAGATIANNINPSLDFEDVPFKSGVVYTFSLELENVEPDTYISAIKLNKRVAGYLDRTRAVDLNDQLTFTVPKVITIPVQAGKQVKFEAEFKLNKYQVTPKAGNSYTVDLPENIINGVTYSRVLVGLLSDGSLVDISVTSGSLDSQSQTTLTIESAYPITHVIQFTNLDNIVSLLVDSGLYLNLRDLQSIISVKDGDVYLVMTSTLNPYYLTDISLSDLHGGFSSIVPVAIPYGNQYLKLLANEVKFKASECGAGIFTSYRKDKVYRIDPDSRRGSPNLSRVMNGMEVNSGLLKPLTMKVETEVTATKSTNIITTTSENQIIIIEEER